MASVRWNEWNLDHATHHGVTPEEVEDVIHGSRPPYPLERGEGKFLIIGRGSGGRFVQVVFVIDDDGTLYPIHARPLNDREKRIHRRRVR